METSKGSNEELGKDQAEVWIKPQLVSFSPVKAAEGISYQPGDGLYNLTP